VNSISADLTQERRLLKRQQVGTLLQLEDDDVQWLIDTRQIVELRIRGKERFDSKDVSQLIESYKITASRRIQ
jgi:hypothetical protein